ncbi:MAG: adenylosuccinate lyase [bacterium]|nr:adenylosuccinate lyase [bacterium]
MPSEAPASPQNPLHERYASRQMAGVFTREHRYGLWRQLWIALAESQRDLGLPISDDQLAALRSVRDQIDFERVAELEEQTRHDVVAHLRHFAELADREAPGAGGVLHLGATSAFLTDNTDVLLTRDALEIVEARLTAAIRCLADFAESTRSVPTLAYTHLQPAQLTTFGKRASLWLQDLDTDLDSIRSALATLKCRGAKGTTGTQASYLSLFDGDHEKVRRLDRAVAEKLGFDSSWPVTGQTYPRKQDSQVLGVLAGIAETLHKFGTDVRLLQGLGVLAEPFEAKQVGSSAMAYKRNPIRSERMCALARRLLTDSWNGPLNAATQWLERSLDDSANRRLVLPDAFLTADAILVLATNIAGGLRVGREAAATLVRRELPFMATENLLMQASRAGGDRQLLHERIREYSMAAHAAVERGEENPLVHMLLDDPDFPLERSEVESFLQPEHFVGRSAEQVEEFLTLIRAKLPEKRAAVEPELVRV